MSSKDIVQPRKRGRPATGKGVPIQVRMEPEYVELLDWYIQDLAAAIAPNNPESAIKTRPEAIRGMVYGILDGVRTRKAKADAKASRKAKGRR